MDVLPDLATQDPIERINARVARVGTGTRRHWEIGLRTAPEAGCPPATAAGIASDWLTAQRWYAVMHGYVDHLGGVNSSLIAGPGEYPESDWLAILRELPDDQQLDTMNAVVKRNLRGALDPLVAALADNRAVDLSLYRLAMPQLREFPKDPGQRAKFLWLSTDLALTAPPAIAMLTDDPYVRQHGQAATEAAGFTLLSDRRELLGHIYDTAFHDGVEPVLTEYRRRHSDAGVTLPWSGLYASAFAPLLKPGYAEFTSAAQRLADLPELPAEAVADLVDLGRRAERDMVELATYFGTRNPRYKSAIRLLRVQALAASSAKTVLPQRGCCGFLANGAGRVCVECVKVPEELTPQQEATRGELWRAREAKLNRKGLRRAR